VNRNEAIEKSAQLFLQVLEHSDNRLTDSVFDYINILREALAMPKDAEPKRHRWDKDGERCKDCGDKDWTATAVCHPPKADAERVALRDAMKRNDLMGRIDEVGDGENLEILLRDIRAYLQGGA
jgi:hypothetical protein